MSFSSHIGAVVCVALIATGQILFKFLAGALLASGNALNVRVVTLGVAALTLYGVATLYWVYLLQNAPLSRLYPYMALSFVLVALASWQLFHETITAAHLAGLGLIVAGLMVIAAGGAR
jgi:drug/metabolite transporter (DMT)-like permease